MDTKNETKGASSEHERGYIEGRRRTSLNLLTHALRELGGFDDGSDDATKLLARHVAERQEVVALLRGLCAEHGDNDWKDTDHLVDVIDKHLMRDVLERARPRKTTKTTT
ncbi:MAG: hypothetical protein ACHREM_02320 [Polyangiales bacterium]